MVGKILICVFWLDFVTGVPEWDHREVELECKVTAVYKDPTSPKYGNHYMVVDCTEAINNKRDLDPNSVRNHPIKIVYKSEERCFNGNR